MKQNKVLIKKSSFSLLNFLKSSKFGAFLLVCSTVLEGFYAYRLFNLTGQHTFEALTFVISLLYASLVTGVIVFFALRNNTLIVWAAVIFEFSMNLLLDVQTVALIKPENWQWIFISQLAIGAILPLATKAFADEVNKTVITRRPAWQIKTKADERSILHKKNRNRTSVSKV
jgi:hypothetical protein